METVNRGAILPLQSMTLTGAKGIYHVRVVKFDLRDGSATVAVGRGRAKIDPFLIKPDRTTETPRFPLR